MQHEMGAVHGRPESVGTAQANRFYLAKQVPAVGSDTVQVWWLGQGRRRTGWGEGEAAKVRAEDGWPAQI